MFLHIAAFEVRFHTRQYLIYVLAGVFFLLTLLATATPNVSIGGNFENLNINASWTIINALTVMNILSMFGAVAFVSNTVLRDFEYGTAELFFSTGISKRDYVLGRFVGALPAVFVLHLSCMAGAMMGELMPWLDQERLAPFSFQPYWFATWAMAVPNLLVMSALFFCVATITRSPMATYVSPVLFLMLFFLLGALTDRETLMLVNMLDPFGISPFQEDTRYWTVFEKNTQIPAMEGALLYNRLLWLGIACLALFAAFRYFPFSLDQGSKTGKKDKENDSMPEKREIKAVAWPASVARNVLPAEQNFRVAWFQFCSQLAIEIKSVVYSIPFIVVMALGMLQVVGSAVLGVDSMFGTDVYPTTTAMVAVINGAFSLPLLVVLVYYSGELMSRERSVKVSEMMDAMPHSDWVMLAAKLTGCVSVIVLMLLSTVAASLLVQIFSGYYDFNIKQYLLGTLYFFQFPLYLMCVLAVFSYLVTRNKYTAMFVMVLYIIYLIAMPSLGYDHYLYLMASPSPPYSVFTGYSQNIEANLWFSFYWLLWGGLILMVARLIWPRGSEDRLATIVKTARQRFTPATGAVIGSLLVAIFVTGGFIYYNTDVMNEHVTRDDNERTSADYEKAYKQYQYLSLPETDRVYVEVDIYPEDQDVYARGYYVLANKTSNAINEIHFSLPTQVVVNALKIPGGKIKLDDENLRYRIYQLENPFMPGDTLKVDFDISWLTPGFKNRPQGYKVVSNGTFFNNLDVLPVMGYNNGRELNDNSIRRKYDLPPVQRARKIDDPEGIKRSSFGAVSRTGFETIVSTASGQTAIAPGYLQKEWSKDGRRYFHYKMDAPIWNFYSFLSADFKVKKEEWNGISIEVYYLHEYNVDRMIEATKKSLTYFQKNFSPYQYRQFRILEFPRYQGTFAQSFPNTIPFSEAIGFVADLRDKSAIDYVFYVTAHELAHQWWAHQVMSADVQGSTMIVESLSQYSALMVMQEEYGKEAMRRFLKYELDSYLRGRGGEIIEELPLYLVENQPYIHYRKASVNLYALQDYIGEEAVNRALRSLISKYGFKGAPFPTTLDLLERFRNEAGSAHQDLITDLFEKIVLFDLKVKNQKVKELTDGRWEVSFDLVTKKLEADGEGREQEVPLSMDVDIGVLGEEQGESKVPEIIYLKKHQLTGDSQSLKLIVDRKPRSVGVDPFNKLVDRNPEDNIGILVF